MMMATGIASTGAKAGSDSRDRAQAAPKSLVRTTHSGSNELSTPDQMLRRLMTATQEKAARLVQQVHPAWVEAALPGHAALSPVMDGVQAVMRSSFLLAELYKVNWPSLVSLRSKAHRVALLAREPALRVLAAGALYVRRGAVRRCVGREARRALVELVGEAAYVALVNAPDAGGPQAALDTSDLRADVWAAEGYRTLHAAGTWTCRDASILTRLTLAPGALDEQLTPVGTAHLNVDVVDFLNKLDVLFPEQAWLFGSNMDRALSE
jgi:hypothetical protein